jgi:uncharacterized membrane protein
LNAYKSQRQIPLSNPLANALVVIVGTLVIGVSLVLGFVAFLVLGSILLVLAAIVGIRLWWFQRQLKKQKGAARAPQEPSAGVFEGEFRVLSRDTDKDRD